MTDKQEDREDCRSLLQNLHLTSTDSNINVNEQIVDDQAMSRVKHSSSMNSLQERKNKICPDDSWSTNVLPGSNVPEKILFVVDTAREVDCTLFETRTSAKFPPLYMIKRVVEIFVNVKSGLNPRHEFGLMTLEARGASFVCDFTKNRKMFLSTLENIEEDVVDQEQNAYDLGPCFEKIAAHMEFEEEWSAPTFVPRVILLYARSHSIPTFSTNQYTFKTLMEYDYFFLDSLYVHEPVSDDNVCQMVYKYLSAMDTKQTSYILEVGRNPATLHTNMAKLIAHPLQRARQDDSPYSFHNPGSP